MARKKGQGRGRLSTVDLLPDDIRIKVNDALRERRMQQVEILNYINDLLVERGLTPISSSAFNRYSINFAERVRKMQHAREAANAIIGKIDVDKNTDIGLATTELVKTAVFDRVYSDQDDLDVDTINKLALAIQRLEKASADSDKRVADIRRRAIEEAAEQIEETAMQMGQTAEQAQFWREKVLGVK